MIRREEKEFIEEISLRSPRNHRTKIEGKGLKIIRRGYWVFWSGGGRRGKSRGRSRVITAPASLKDSLKEEYVNSKVMAINIKKNWKRKHGQ